MARETQAKFRLEIIIDTEALLDFAQAEVSALIKKIGEYNANRTPPSTDK